MPPRTGLISALIYTGIAVAASLLFLATTGDRGYNLIARIGGAVWVFVLLMIILMPLVISLVKKGVIIK